MSAVVSWSIGIGFLPKCLQFVSHLSYCSTGKPSHINTHAARHTFETKMSVINLFRLRRNWEPFRSWLRLTILWAAIWDQAEGGIWEWHCFLLDVEFAFICLGLSVHVADPVVLQFQSKMIDVSEWLRIVIYWNIRMLLEIRHACLKFTLCIE